MYIDVHNNKACRTSCAFLDSAIRPPKAICKNTNHSLNKADKKCLTCNKVSRLVTSLVARRIELCELCELTCPKSASKSQQVEAVGTLCRLAFAGCDPV